MNVADIKMSSQAKNMLWHAHLVANRHTRIRVVLFGWGLFAGWLAGWRVKPI